MLLNQFQSPRWLNTPLVHGHVQTIVPALMHRLALPAFERQRVITPDGDFVDIDWLWPYGADPAARPPQQLITFFHGLEGSSASHYVRAMAYVLAGQSVALAVPHFRGCSGEPNQLPRAYHSGDAQEIDFLLRTTQTHFQHKTGLTDYKRYAVGVSLGGNALLKWAGENGQHAASMINGISAISAPMDLAAGGEALSKGFAQVYQHMFVRTLKVKALEKHQRFGALFNVDKMRTARSLYEFDNLFTAPIHGFLNTEDYWRRASAKPLLSQIQVPSLVINALNDPFLPARALATPDQVSRHVQLYYPKHGGHVGFMSAPFPGRIAWLPEVVTQFLWSHS